MFFLTMFLMEGSKQEPQKEVHTKSEFGYDNNTFTNDDGRVSTLELPRLYPSPPHRFENSRL